jgi:membrane protein YqaA with SNARE-associated domain
MTKNNYILLLVGTSFILLGVAVTGNSNLLGALLGYGLGYLLTLWLHRDTLRSVDDEVVIAVKRMRRSFFARLGTVTLVVAAVGRFQEAWLLPLALGLALGLILSLVSSMKHILKNGKG